MYLSHECAMVRIAVAHSALNATIPFSHAVVLITSVFVSETNNVWGIQTDAFILGTRASNGTKVSNMNIRIDVKQCNTCYASCFARTQPNCEVTRESLKCIPLDDFCIPFLDWRRYLRMRTSRYTSAMSRTQDICVHTGYVHRFYIQCVCTRRHRRFTSAWPRHSGHFPFSGSFRSF